MNRFLQLSLLVCVFVCCQSYAGTIDANRMLGDFEFIKNSFDVKYAPRLWKQEFCKWDLFAEYNQAKKALTEQNRLITLKDYHRLLKKFFMSTKDYHVGINFYSTERATLPFRVKSSNKRYFVVDVDRDGSLVDISKLLAPMLTEGDEILTFGGEPIDQVIQKLKTDELGGNTSETDQALAELILTNRSGARGEIVPRGNVDITIKKRFTDKQITYTYTWDHRGEKIVDVSQKKVLLNAPQALFAAPSLSATEEDFFQKLMVSPLFLAEGAKRKRDNKYEVGSRISYVPKLGKKIWESDEGCAFHAYIFTLPSTSAFPELKIGYVRLPHYMAGKDEAEDFCEIISQFQWRTEALIIDQINNPGGALFYLYALASMLTESPLSAPKHHIAITQQEVFSAHKLLAALESVTDDISAKEIIGESLQGYPVDHNFAQLMRQFCNFVIAEWESGNHYTGLTHVFGIDQIMPHPKARYTKPILLLTNSLDFSGADFLPAILQDNKRVKILGTRTAGAGGYVSVTQFPNKTGIATIAITGSLAERLNNKPIENLGVTPDIPYECTPQDLQGNYEGYAAAILRAVETILREKA